MARQCILVSFYLLNPSVIRIYPSLSYAEEEGTYFGRRRSAPRLINNEAEHVFYDKASI